MILDSGLNNAAKYDFGNYSGYSYNYKWVVYTAVGTGSTAPAATQTALVTETHRSGANGGFAEKNEWERDTVNGKIRAKLSNTRVFDFTASFNLTEFGHVPVSSGGLFTYRDLFRTDPNDPASSPITLSVQSGDQLQLTHTQIIELPWVDTADSFTITGTAGNDTLGKHDGDAVFFSSHANYDSHLFQYVFWPGGATSATTAGALKAITATTKNARDAAIAGDGTGVAMAFPAYTDGNYYRDRSAKFTTAQVNITQYGWVVYYTTSGTNLVAGFRFYLSNPTSFTKASTHTLELTFRSTWARG